MIFLLIPLFIILVGAGIYSAFTCRPLLILMVIAGAWCWWPKEDAHTTACENVAADVEAHARQWAKEDGVPYVSPLEHVWYHN